METSQTSQGTERILRRKLWLAIGLSGVIFVIELVGGFLTNSLALMSDSLHVLSDTLSLGLTLGAIYLASLPATDKRTYGWHRLEIFAALLNGLLLALMSVGIVWEAVQRAIYPPKVHAEEMLSIAAIGLVINLVVAWLLYRESKHSLNIRSAVLHVLGDAASSVGVIIAGLVMATTEWFVVDPALSILIALVILYGGWRVGSEAVHILLEGTPKDLQASAVVEALKSMPRVIGAHDLHVWSLCSNCRMLSAHLVIEERALQDSSSLVSEVNTMLRQKFGITHATIQLEAEDCGDGGYLCNHQHEYQEQEKGGLTYHALRPRH